MEQQEKVRQEPLVSVIVPVYRSDRIRRCIKSVTVQSYERWELILVDDGSPDGAGEVCDDYARRDPRIRVIHQENRGISAARNTGLDACRGDVLCFIDDDDYIHPDLMKESLRKMGESESDMVCFYAEELRGGGKKSLMEWTYAGPQWDTEQIRAKGLCFRLLMVWSKLYKRELWDHVRFPEGHVAEDVWVTVPLWEKARIVSVLPQVLYFYDQSPHGSVTQSWEATQDYDACRAYGESLRLIKADPCEAVPQLEKLYDLYHLRSAVTGLYNDRRKPVLTPEQRQELVQAAAAHGLQEKDAGPILSNDLYFRILETERTAAETNFPEERRHRMMRCAMQAYCMDCAEPQLDAAEKKKLEVFIDQWEGQMRENETVLQWCIRHGVQSVIRWEGRRLIQKFSRP